MAHQFKIVVENEGKSAPDAFFLKMIAQYPSSYGCASVDADGVLQIFRQTEGASMGLLHTIREKYGESKRYSVFGKADGKMADEEVQPYSLQQIRSGEGEEPEDAIISFLDGEFPQCAKTGSALAPAYFASEETLYPLFQLVAEQAKDLEEIVENIENDAIIEEVTNLLSTSTNGSIVILGTNITPGTQGSVLIRSIGDSEKEYPWGWVSDHIGFGEEENKAPTSESQDSKDKPGKKIVLLKKKEKENGKKEERSPEPKKEEPKSGADKDKGDKTTPDAGEGYEFLTPPGDVRGKALEDWYKARTPNGKLPSSDIWMNRKAIRVKKAAGSQMAKGLEGMKKLPQTTPTEKKDSLPVISEAELKAYDTEFVKGRFRDSTGKPVPNPFTFKEFEGKLPTFTEAMAGLGIKDISDVYSWPVPTLQHLVEKYPMMSVNLLMQLIRTAATQAEELKALKPAEIAKPATVTGKKVLDIKKKTG